MSSLASLDSKAEVPLVENVPRYTGSDLAPDATLPIIEADSERNAAE